MSRNIIICCDGTGNQLDESYSNVVKLYSAIERAGDQIVYYDAGIGTLPHDDVVNPFWRKVKKFSALALGLGLEENVSQAYSFLMNTYQEGDRIFLFGFSRGAYTVRVLAGLIREMGLLDKNCQHLIPYAWSYYRKCYTKELAPITRNFRQFFSRHVGIHFMGIWDTVSSVGLLFGYKSYPHTYNNDRIQALRHAVAIDEKRRFYRQNLINSIADPTQIKQVWFAGAHSDVGGSYPFRESGLSHISLLWMIREAKEFQLRFDDAVVRSIIPPEDSQTNAAPDDHADVHPSLSGFWWLFELWPRKDRETKRWFPPLGAPRKMFINASGDKIRPVLHESVVRRLKARDSKYAPQSLANKTRDDYDVEEDDSVIRYRTQLMESVEK